MNPQPRECEKFYLNVKIHTFKQVTIILLTFSTHVSTTTFFFLYILMIFSMNYLNDVTLICLFQEFNLL